MREIQKSSTIEELNQQIIELRNQLATHTHSFIGSGFQQGEVISGFLRSSDYVAGSSGWMIGANNNCEFNSGVFRGTLSAASGTLGAITIGSNAWHVDSAGNMWWGDYASYAAATIKISSAGVVDFTTGNFSGTLASGISITSPTITGGTIQTATSGKRIVIDNASNDITIYDTTQLVGTIYGSSSSLWLQSNVTGGNISFANGVTLLATISSAGTFALARSGQSVNVQSDGTFGWLTLGTFLSSSEALISSNTNFYVTGNITLSGTVDGVDISAHANDISAHHSYTSNGYAITPASVTASGNISGVELITTNGVLYHGSYLMLDMYSTYQRSGVLFGFKVRSGTPGAASSFQGCMYYDTAQSDLVFSNGSNWYKVNATQI